MASRLQAFAPPRHSRPWAFPVLGLALLGLALLGLALLGLALLGLALLGLALLGLASLGLRAHKPKTPRRELPPERPYYFHRLHRSIG